MRTLLKRHKHLLVLEPLVWYQTEFTGKMVAELIYCHIILKEFLKSRFTSN